MRLPITSRAVGVGYTAIVVALLLAHGATWALDLAGYPYQLGLRSKFDLDAEASIPAMFAALSLLLCGGLLGIVAAHRQGRGERYLQWALLALIFVFLSIDEATSLHELLVNHMRRFFEPTGPLRFAWIVPYGIATIIGLALYWPWLRALPSPTRRRFILAAVLYITGAIGMEMVGGQLMDSGYRGTAWYTLGTTLEETLEFAGVGVFLCALVDYLSGLGVDLSLGFKRAVETD